MDHKKVLILGGSGLLGSNWATKIRSIHHVTLGLHKNLLSLKDTDNIILDFNHINDIECKINHLRPDIIINSIGATNVDFCENNILYANYLNVDIPYRIAKISKQINAKFVHISTDHLFSGNSSFYSEKSAPFPVNVYARSKYLAEKKISQVNNDALIVRTNFFGWGSAKRKSFSDWIIDSLRANSEIQVFDDVFFTPIIMDRLIDAVNELLFKNVTGIINVVGSERISKYDFACNLADTFNLQRQLLKPVKLKDSQLIAPRPLDMSLSCQLVQSLINSDMGSLSLDFEKLKQQEFDKLRSATLNN